MLQEIQKELTEHIIPFWRGLRDDEYGGYYGLMDFDLKLDKKAEKGAILNSRILWFFSRAFNELKDISLLEEADHAYKFLKDKLFCDGNNILRRQFNRILLEIPTERGFVNPKPFRHFFSRNMLFIHLVKDTIPGIIG